MKLLFKGIKKKRKEEENKFWNTVKYLKFFRLILQKISQSTGPCLGLNILQVHIFPFECNALLWAGFGTGTAKDAETGVDG